tara:strand:+ start:1597 stop:1794 length:198 start_codon:yes stop_codon:yes gene_type:complete
LEGYTLKNIASLIRGAESVIVITVKDNDVHLSFSKSLSEMEALDLLTLVTSEFFEVAKEDNTPLH